MGADHQDTLSIERDRWVYRSMRRECKRRVLPVPGPPCRPHAGTEQGYVVLFA